MYTVVGEDYMVTIHKSFASVFRYVNDADMYLGPDSHIQLTAKALKAMLKEHNEARIYKANNFDWYEKIQVH